MFLFACVVVYYSNITLQKYAFLLGLPNVCMFILRFDLEWMVI